MKSNDYNQAGQSAKQSLIDIFVDNQQKLMAQLEGLFTFEPKFVKLPTMGEQRFSDFESPTVDQLKLFPLKKEIKLCQIGFKTNGMNLSGIQLMFTNGVETPLFESANAVNRELQTFDIDMTTIHIPVGQVCPAICIGADASPICGLGEVRGRAELGKGL